MIGLLKGTVDTIRPTYVLVDTGTVGYKVLANVTILSKLKTGDSVKLYTYTYVREDALELFGFENPDDLSLFELLITISGVGPKTALGIFAKGSHVQIKNAILSQDVEFFSGIPRLGRKNAQKIIIELRGKLGDSSALLDLGELDEEKEISTALKDFGFKPDEIKETLKKIRGTEGSVEQKLKLALKQLAK